MDWELALRIINSVGCLFALWIMSVGAFRQRGKWNDKTQDIWMSYFGWIFLGLTGAIEATVREITVGPSSILKLLVVAITIRALLRYGSVETHNRGKPWKKETE